MKRFLLFCLIILSQCAWEWPSGWDLGVIKPTGINYPVVPIANATTNLTLTTYQSGNIIVFTGTSNNTSFTLPSAVIGLEYSFIDDTTKFISIRPQTVDTIQITSTVQGNTIANSASTAIGNSITLVCRSANTWSIKSQSGTWATASNL